MPNIRVPDEREKKIIRENGMDPKCYGVRAGTQDENVIRLLCYKTRDDVTVRKGDRPW